MRESRARGAWGRGTAWNALQLQQTDEGLLRRMRSRILKRPEFVAERDGVIVGPQQPVTDERRGDMMVSSSVNM